MGKEKAIILFIVLLISTISIFAGEQEIKQHMTDITRDSVARINSHTDEKYDAITVKGEELIKNNQVILETTTRNASIKIFIAVTGAIVFGGSIVLLLMNLMWKRYTEILPLANLDEKRKEARIWALEQRGKGFGNRNIIKTLRASMYSKKDIFLIMKEIN